MIFGVLKKSSWVLETSLKFVSEKGNKPYSMQCKKKRLLSFIPPHLSDDLLVFNCFSKYDVLTSIKSYYKFFHQLLVLLTSPLLAKFGSYKVILWSFYVKVRKLYVFLVHTTIFLKFVNHNLLWTNKMTSSQSAC